MFFIGVISGTGFTVAIFVAGKAFVEVTVMEAAKMFAMFSVVAAVIGIVFNKMLGVRKCER